MQKQKFWFALANKWLSSLGDIIATCLSWLVVNCLMKSSVAAQLVSVPEAPSFTTEDMTTVFLGRAPLPNADVYLSWTSFQYTNVFHSPLDGEVLSVCSSACAFWIFRVAHCRRTDRRHYVLCGPVDGNVLIRVGLYGLKGDILCSFLCR